MALAVSAGLASIVKASAQPPERIRRVGMLMNGVAANGTAQSYVQTFVQGLKSLGWIELLKQIAPNVQRVLLIFNPETSPQSKVFLQSIEEAAPSFSVEIAQTTVQDAADIETAIEGFARRPNGGLIIPTDTFTQMRRGLIVELAARHWIPAIYTSPDFVRNGGLIYYGFDFVEQFRQAAPYVDRILKGAKPGDLPVQQPTKFALIINRKVANALGLQVPPTLLARADEVIE
jgi:putative ABC transport system substrate-binding protein